MAVSGEALQRGYSIQYSTTAATWGYHLNLLTTYENSLPLQSPNTFHTSTFILVQLSALGQDNRRHRIIQFQ
jgi:hypothetical protein